MKSASDSRRDTDQMLCGVSFDALGTEIDLQIVVKREDAESARLDLLEAQKKYDAFTKIFSRFDEQSELSKLNAELNVFNDVSGEIFEIAEHCLRFNEQTSGIFDPRIIDTLEDVGYANDFKRGNFTVIKKSTEKDRLTHLREDLKIRDGKVMFNARMDFSGIAKGFITDKISEFLSERGWKNFLVDSGGDMHFAGKNQMREDWKIDIEGISSEKMTLSLSEMAVATSGISRRKWEVNGEKFHHLINPKNREQFLFDLKTVTVIADSTEKADVWAKTLFLLGKSEGISLAKKKLIPAVFLGYDGGAWISPEIKNFIR